MHRPHTINRDVVDPETAATNVPMLPQHAAPLTPAGAVPSLLVVASTVPAVAVANGAADSEDQKIHAPPAPTTSVSYSITVCLLFAFLSTACTLHNKYVFTYVYKSSNGLLLVQNVFTVAVLFTLKQMGVLRYSVSLSHRGDWISGLLYSLNVMCGLWSLVFVNVAMFGALKRSTIVVSWTIEFFFDRKSTTVASLPPLLFMMIGTFIASEADMTFSLPGYVLALCSCVAQGGAFELGRRVALGVNKGIWSVLFANSTVSIVLQIGMVAVTGELTGFIQALFTPSIAVHFFVNSVACMLLNYSVFLNCTVNSPLAHTVVGNLKTVVTTLFGVLLFVTPISRVGWVGLGGNFVGGAWFSFMKLSANAKTGGGLRPSTAAASSHRTSAV